MWNNNNATSTCEGVGVLVNICACVNRRENKNCTWPGILGEVWTQVLLLAPCQSYPSPFSHIISLGGLFIELLRKSVSLKTCLFHIDHGSGGRCEHFSYWNFSGIELNGFRRVWFYIWLHYRSLFSYLYGSALNTWNLPFKHWSIIFITSVWTLTLKRIHPQPLNPLLSLVVSFSSSRSNTSIQKSV